MILKKIEKNSIKYLIFLIVALALCGMILYPIFDLILCKFITNSEFIYSVHSYIIQPILFACVFGTVFWFVTKR